MAHAVQHWHLEQKYTGPAYLVSTALSVFWVMGRWVLFLHRYFLDPILQYSWFKGLLVGSGAQVAEVPVFQPTACELKRCTMLGL